MNLTPTMKDLIRYAYELGAEHLAIDVANSNRITIGLDMTSRHEVLALFENRGERIIQDEVKRRVR